MLLLQVKTSAVNVEFLKISKDIQNIFAPGGVPLSQVPGASVSASDLLVHRIKQLKNLNINQVSLQGRPVCCPSIVMTGQ